MVSEQSYMSVSKWSLVVTPFFCSWRTEEGLLKEASQAPVREHVTPFNTASHLPVARGHSCSLPEALRTHTKNRSHVAEEKSY
jgi:hypothetical protein